MRKQATEGQSGVAFHSEVSERNRRAKIGDGRFGAARGEKTRVVAGTGKGRRASSSDFGDGMSAIHFQKAARGVGCIS
jgi:hypothetical protein